MAEARRGVQLDPFSWASHNRLGASYWICGLFDEAIAEFHRALQIDSHNALTRSALADAYACSGQMEKAVEECVRAQALEPEVMIVRLHLAVTYAKVGKVAETRKTIKEAKKDWKSGDGSALWIAGAHARLGEKDAAFEWLERAIEERAAMAIFLKTHPFFADLQDDPRLHALAKRMNIPD